MSDDPKRLMDVFADALLVPIGDRGAYLDRACSGDGELRLQVEALLRAHETAGEFLEKPAGEFPSSGNGSFGLE